MATPIESVDPAPPAGKGDQPDGGNDGPPPKMYSEEEVERRLRGKHGEVERMTKAAEAARQKLADLEAKLRERDETAAAEQGKFKELWETEKAKAKDLEAKHNALAEKETKRLEAVVASNKERRKALPDEFKELIPSGLSPDAEADHLAKLATLVTDEGGNGVFGSGPRPPKRAATEDEKIAALHKRAADVQLGRKPADDRGVRR